MVADARILIVCTGNICRSPFIERLLQRRLDERRLDERGMDERRLDERGMDERRLDERGMDDRRPGSGPTILVRSAGTGALTGSSMDERAAAQLVAHGGNPLGFMARALTPALIAESDLVLTATRAHRGVVASMYPKVLRKVFTFRDFADLVADMDGLNAKIDDPHPDIHELNAGMDDLNANIHGLNTRAAHTDPRAWVRQVTERAAASRGQKPPLEPAQVDILDPFRREDEVFATMAQQIVGSMRAVVRALAG